MTIPRKKFCHRCLVEESHTTSERDGDIYEVSGGGHTRDLCYACMEAWRVGSFPLYIVEAPLPEGCSDVAPIDLGQMLVAPDGTPICSAAGCPLPVVRWEVESVLGFCRRHGLLDTV